MVPPPPQPLPVEEMSRRINELLDYRGTEPEVLRRQQRLVQLLQIFRERRAKAEARRAARRASKGR